ncbi:MAG TPA: hypothetical protein DEB31_08920 [Clostridiales bacterium]|nr:hypothetical protein [Clostridiales bacterium]
MPGKRMDDSELELHPETRFKGILYELDKLRVTDEDLPVVSGRVSRPRKEKPANAIRGKRTAAAARDKIVLGQVGEGGRVRREEYTRHTGKGLSGARRLHMLAALLQSRKNKKQKFNDRQGMLADKIIKTTMLACAAVAVVSAIAIPTGFAKPTADITLNDGGRVMQAPTSAATVGEFLSDNLVRIGAEDILETSPNTPITEGMEIIIRRAMPVMVHTQDQTYTVPMVAGTVQDVLSEVGLTVAETDEIYPSPDTLLHPGMEIEHIIVNIQYKSEYERIPFETEQEKDSTILEDEIEVVRYGEEGEMEIRTKLTYKNGMLTDEKMISETVTKQPINQLEKVGTWVPIRTPNGDICKYVLSKRTTAYCSACNTGNKTAVGTYPRRDENSFGTIAAKDSKLPYGTWVFIPGYGYGKVEDTGGFSEDTIDLYMGDFDTCTCGERWGVRYKDVYVLA